MAGSVNRHVPAALHTYNAYANELVLDTAGKLTESELAQEGSPSLAP